MGLPTNFGIRGQVTPTRDRAASMPLLQMSIHSNTTTDVINPENALDGRIDTYAEFDTTDPSTLWIDLGDWYKISSVMLVVESGGGTGIIRMLRFPDMNFTAQQSTIVELFNGSLNLAKSVFVLEPSGTDQRYVRYLTFTQSAAIDAKIYMIMVSTA